MSLTILAVPPYFELTNKGKQTIWYIVMVEINLTTEGKAQTMEVSTTYYEAQTMEVSTTYYDDLI